MVSPPLLLLVCVLAGVLAPRDAACIIMRHDIDATAYLVGDAEHPWLVDLLGPGDCMGTLIDPSYLLTVAHCAEEMSPDQTIAIGSEGSVVVEIVLHPQYRGDEHDIALIRFGAPVADVSPVGLYRERDEAGQVLQLLGRGLHGTGLEGEPGATDDGRLRRATNTITQATEEWLEVRFEAPGESGITELEGVGAGGDSGGPALLESNGSLVVAGLNSWGEGPGSLAVGQYGALDHAARVSSYLPWIDATIARIDPGTGGGVSGPGGCSQAGRAASPATAWGWLVGILLCRRRRRAAG